MEKIISNEQILQATRVFLDQMRLEWVRRNPTRTDCPIKNFEDYDNPSKSALLKAIKRALLTI